MGKTIFLRLLYSYLRHRWLYLLPIVLLTIAAGYYLVTLKRLYISSGVIYTEQTTMLASLTSVESDGFSWNTPAQDTANQISDLIRTDAFLRAVIQETDLEAEMSKGDAVVRETISEVRKRVWTMVSGRNQVQLSASNKDPRIAYQLAQALINTFIQWRINLDRIDTATAGKFFEELIKEYRTDVKEAQQALMSYLEMHPQPLRGDRSDLELMEIQNLQAELDFAGKRLAEALNKAENARLAETQLESNILQKFTVVDAPDLPEKPATSRGQMAMNATIFLAAGVLLSAIAVVGASVLDRSFRIPLDVQGALDLPVLAIVPDAAGPVEKKRLWKRQQKAIVKAEAPVPFTEEPGKAPIAVDLQHLKVNKKQAQRVEKL